MHRDLINFLLSPAMYLLPILVTKHFGGGALHLGWMDSAWGIGLVSGGLLLGAWGGFRRRVITSMVGLIGMGLSALLVGLVPAWAFILGVRGMFLLGLAHPITNGPLFATLQAAVAPEMQGRVFTVMISASSAMAPLGMAVAGPVADRFGVPLWFLLAGLSCLLMAVVGLASPALRHMEGRHYSPEAAVSAPEMTG